VSGRRTVVIAQPVGRLANRVLLFAHFIGAALEHGFSIVNPAFGTYAHLFPSTSRDLLCRFPPARSLPAPPGSRQLLIRAAQAAADLLHRRQRAGRDVGLVRLARTESMDLDGEGFLAVLRRHRVVFVQDWFFRSTRDVERHAEAIRAFFTPSPAFLARGLAAFDRARGEADLVVGVHLRQGDYASYKSGRYFYAHREYAAILGRIERAFPERRIAFLICSDAPLPEGAFASHRVSAGPGGALEDLYALAACDRLVGPPSTFSRWASFYGRVPLCILHSADERIEAASFRPDVGLGGR
jgi:hypothetical protein